MEHYMAEFGQGFVQAAVLSENNAVKYKLSIAGSCTKSTVKPYIKFQDEIIGPTDYGDGLTVLVFDVSTNSIIETKSYNFTNTPSAVNRAFMTYVDSLTEERVLFFISNGKLRTCEELVAWFAKKSSTSWPSVWKSDNYDISYSAFYITVPGAISAEHVLYNDGVQIEDVSTPLDVIYDYYSDIGATGFPSRIIEYDGTKMSNGDGNEILRLPDDGVTSSMEAHNIKSGDTLYLKFELFADSELCLLGTTRLSIRWFNDLSMVLSHNIDYDIFTPNIWQKFEREYIAPDGCNKFTVYIAKTDSSGEGGVRNVVLGEMSREETPMFRPAEFGVNGIRMNRMIDGTVPELLILNDSSTDDRGIVRSAEFREL